MPSATTDIGTNAIRLSACAACCSIPANIVKRGMSSVPPPIPIPPMTPPSKPIIMRSMVFTVALLSRFQPTSSFSPATIISTANTIPTQTLFSLLNKSAPSAPPAVTPIDDTAVAPQSA